TNTLAYTEPFYLHSIIGFPYYLLTHDPLDTYMFIFFVQLIIGITGYYFLARNFSSSLIAITLSGLYFVFLPTFYSAHPHINFYGFLPWFFFFLLQFFRTRESKYVYLTSLAFLLQASVGVYFQLFMLILAMALTPLILVYLLQDQKWKQFPG